MTSRVEFHREWAQRKREQAFEDLEKVLRNIEAKVADARRDLESIRSTMDEQPATGDWAQRTGWVVNALVQMPFFEISGVQARVAEARFLEGQLQPVQDEAS